MVKKKTKQVGGTDWKLKKWYPIIAPRVLNNAILGETIVSEASQLPGKTVKVSLMTVLGDMKKQNNWVTMRITEVKDNKAFSKIIAYEISPSAIRRFVRRSKNKIDSSFLCVTGDGVQVRVKPLLLTAADASNSKVAAIRKRTREYLLRAIANLSYEDLFNYVIRGKLQMDLKAYVNKIYPIKRSDIRMLVFVKEGVEVDKSLLEKEKPRQEPRNTARSDEDVARTHAKPEEAVESSDNAQSEEKQDA